MRKKINKSLIFILCWFFIFFVVGCGKNDNTLDRPEPNYLQNIPNIDVKDENYWNVSSEPNVNITVIGAGKELTDKEEKLAEEAEKQASLQSMVFSAVSCDLMEAGFNVGTGVALSIEDDSVEELGLYYYSTDNNLFDEESNLRSVGFFSIKSDMNCNNEAYLNNMLMVIDINDLENDITNICTYNYENVNSYHFVYKNKYLIYYLESEMIIKYDVYDNKRENYNLSIGSLYNYDTNTYIYDESIYGEYERHSGESIFSEIDYQKLQDELKAQIEYQNEIGYSVDEYEIVYISPEAIQAYLDSEEESTFFGYTISSLTETFGLGTALTFTDNGFKTSKIIEESENGYNWKSFLIKCGIGCGIILVGAVLSPITGGASFGCALLTISKIAVTYALTSAIGTLAIETASGLIQGKDIKTALTNATFKGLDAFANGFMIGAAIGSIGVVSGIIKPTACFTAGTLINNGNNEYTLIEEIKVGDYVLSYDEKTGKISKQKVTNIFSKKVNKLVYITIGNEVIKTTYNHPFYLASFNCWISACELKKGYELLSVDGSFRKISNIETIYFDKEIDVYNFTVDNNHTYFVGLQSVLVHNECTTISSKHNKLRKEAWKEELEAVKNGTSKYNWTSKQILELKKTGQIKGYEVVHIADKSRLIGTANESLAWSTDNTVFLRQASRTVGTVGDPIKNQHLWVHMNNWHEATNTDRIVQLLPWAAEKVAKILKLVG